MQLTDEEIRSKSLVSFFGYIIKLKDEREISRITTVYLHYLVHNQDIHNINLLFTSTNMAINQMSLYYLIALLRSSAVYKEQIDKWDDVLKSTRSICISSQLNPDKELWGLKEVERIDKPTKIDFPPLEYDSTSFGEGIETEKQSSFSRVCIFLNIGFFLSGLLFYYLSFK